MYRLPSPTELEEEAIYLAILTARRTKPLSRLEYDVQPDLLQLFREMGLVIAPLTRIAQDGTKVAQWILATDPGLVEQYKAEFDGAVIQGETPSVIQTEACYFGFPACCADAYANAPHAQSDLSDEVRSLLFHHPCPGCKQTPGLIPLYRTALAETKALHEKLRAERDR